MSARGVSAGFPWQTPDTVDTTQLEQLTQLTKAEIKDGQYVCRGQLLGELAHPISGKDDSLDN